MINIILNYDYENYPGTTASYFEKALKRIKGINTFRTTDNYPVKADLIINIMPCDMLFLLPDVPSCYYEIDCHLTRARHPEYYDLVDKVYIAQEPFLPLYPKEKTKYLPLACDPEVHKRIKNLPQAYDIGFIGNDTYPERRVLLDILDANFKLLRTNSKSGIPYSTLLNQCKLTFNRSMYQDVNMRFFEAIGCGRMLLTDHLKAQDDLAKVKTHYEVYSDSKDLVQKVKYYLEHEKEREEIALKGMNHIKSHHTYDKRLKVILDDFLLYP